MEFDPLPDFSNTGFTIIKTGLFYDGEHLEAKIIMQIHDFLTR